MSAPAASLCGALLAVSRWIEHVTGWSVRKFVQTERRYRTIQIQAGNHVITAADPIHNGLRASVTKINNGSWSEHKPDKGRISPCYRCGTRSQRIPATHLTCPVPPSR